VLNPVLVEYLDDSSRTPILSAEIGEDKLRSRETPVGLLNSRVAQKDFAELFGPEVE
jgi:hypothetical protein